jgi:hypothetical protein
MMKMMEATRLAVLFLGIAVFPLAQSPASESKPLPSMRYSCNEDKVLLSASVSTPRRDGVPKTDINLMDPSSRQQGAHLTSAVIPESRYEVVVQMPTLPKISREHAIEICGAEQGEYRLTIHEHGDERYGVTIAAITEKDSEYLPLKLQAQEARAREFRFRFTMKKGQVRLTWLDENGHPQVIIVDNDW